eukprot:scaffold2003_cov420-Prasinococcus_capsulatus_cf.AAC.3
MGTPHTPQLCGEGAASSAMECHRGRQDAAQGLASRLKPCSPDREGHAGAVHVHALLQKIHTQRLRVVFVNPPCLHILDDKGGLARARVPQQANLPIPTCSTWRQ